MYGSLVAGTNRGAPHSSDENEAKTLEKTPSKKEVDPLAENTKPVEDLTGNWFGTKNGNFKC